MKLVDLLVALTVSELEMYPLIQAYVWKKIGKEFHLLKKVKRPVCECSATNKLYASPANCIHKHLIASSFFKPNTIFVTSSESNKY